MAKYDDQLNRMLFLMEDKNSTKKANSNIEYHANGADGKVYGILKEGTKYYIKTTESGKENLSESYDYINGFNNRRENEFKSYNEATKQLELKLMSLNEAYGKHEDVSTVDFKRGEKTLANLTEAARVEIDRMNQIFENSFISKDNIGNHGNPESKGSSTGANTIKNNEPFEEKASASLDKDPKFNGTVEKSTDNKEVKGVDADLQSDKMKKANTDTKNDYKDAHDDLDGEGVADKKVSGAKSVKMNESCFEDGSSISTLGDEDPDLNAADFEGEDDLEASINGLNDNDFFHNPDVPDNEQLPAPPAEVEVPELAGADDAAVGNDVVGQGENDLDSLLEEFESTYGKPAVDHSNQDMIAGEDDVMKNTCSQKGTDGKDAEWERIDEDGNVNEPTKQGNEETMKSFQKKGNLPVQSWDKMDKVNEAINSIVTDVYKRLTESKKPAKKKETLQEAIDRIVAEEVTKLDAWGKHPRYQTPAFKTPANKEVLAGTAEKDWNDDSAKGEEPYGKKIGDGTPFEKVVNMLTDQVMTQLKESMKKSK